MTKQANLATKVAIAGFIKKIHVLMKKLGKTKK